MEKVSAIRQYLREAGQALRLRGPLAHDPKARIFHALLLVLIGWSVLETTVMLLLPLFVPKPLGATVFAFGVLGLLASLVLLYRGSFVQASLVYLLGNWLTCTVITLLNGGIRSPGQAFYLALPVSAAWLLGYRATLLTAAGCLISSLFMAFLEFSGLSVPILVPGRPFSVWAALVEATIMAVVPVARALQILTEALAESKRAQEALRQERDLVGRIMETSPVAIVAVDQEGKVMFANTRAEGALGVMASEAICRAYVAAEWQMFGLDGRPLSSREPIVQQVMSLGRPVYAVQCTVEQPDGRRILLSVNAAPILTGTGRFDGIVAAIQDITERVRAEEELRQHKDHLEDLVQRRTAELVEARDQAQAASRAKSVFLANMSHELRTPLNAILGFSNLLHDEPGLSEEQRGDLEIINRSGDHLLKLIDDVLDMAKIEAGGSLVENAPLDLRKLIRDVTDLMRLRAEQKNLEFILKDSLQFPRFVVADAAKLRQVLINLIGNAIKYTDQGSVTLRMDAAPADDPQHVLLRFEVLDTGVGIPIEDQARIFDAFVQVAGTGKQNGTGLGLAITRQYVEQMGGIIFVESAPGEGSVFRVHVPARRAEESEVTAGVDRHERVIGLTAGQPEYRVLIVEDEMENRLLLHRLLQRAGFHVRVAADGAAGVETFQAWRPHFIWMDRHLPGIDGLETARRIRALEGGNEVKIVAVTASVFADQRDEMLHAGLDDFVRKPYLPVEIFDFMARYLGVKYVYGESPAVYGEGLAAGVSSALASLPKKVRRELSDALIRLDTVRIAETISRITKLDAALGAALAEHAGRFAFTRILRSLNNAATSRKEEGDDRQEHHSDSR